MKTARLSLVAAFLIVLTSTLAFAQSGALDYAQWRGQARDGSASGFEEPATWPESLTRRWRIDIGEGYATPLVVGDRVYTHARRGGDEIMMALEAASGTLIWETSYPAPYKMNPATSGHGQGPKATPLFHDGKLFTMGISGIVSAFDAATGRVLWQTDPPPVDPTFGTATSPLADGTHVIVHVGGHDQGALTAFDANTGAVVWRWAGDGPAYGSPFLASLDGTRQVVTISQQNVVGVSAATGELLWQRPIKSTYDNNSITPIQHGETLVISAQDKGITALRPARRNGQWNVEVVWETAEAGLYMSNGVLVDGTLFGLSHLNSGQFFALDVEDGSVLWTTRGREAENTAFVKAGTVLFMLNDDGELIVARANRTAFEPLRRYTVAETATWAQPTVSGNRIFVKDISSLALWTLN
jgi:outer membrane protein assembly factor BamB